MVVTHPLASFLISVLLVAALVVGCGGGAPGDNSEQSSSPSSSGVTVTPSTAAITAGGSQQFTASMPSNWSVDGVAGGNTSLGTISASGLYIAPSTAGNHTVKATSSTDTSKSGSAVVTVTAAAASSAPAVLTYHNNNARTGLNPNETALTPGNVNPKTFGKKFSFAVDGAVFAQPLYVPNLSINGVTRNVLYVATEHNSVYAFDADGKTLTPLWRRSFLNPAEDITTVPACQACGRTSLGPEVGITGTPVIDLDSKTLFVAAMTQEDGQPAHHLHALDLLSGAEKFGGPKRIQASVRGKGKGSNLNGQVPFHDATHNQRPGLLLLNGALYLCWAAFSDVEPYHGWVMAYDATTLDQIAAFNVSPDSSAGGIWAGGGAPAADSEGNVYVTTGNGYYDQAGEEWGQSFLKLRLVDGKLSVVDSFTPFNWVQTNAFDLDIGSGAPTLLPGDSPPRLLVSGTKDGKIYLLDRDSLGRFHQGDNSQIVQEINLNPPFVTSGTRPRMYSSPAYWNGFVYFGTANGNLKAYGLSNGKLSLASQSNNHFTSRGGIPVVSANGTSNGVVWLVERITSTGQTVLRAYDAINVSKEIYTSNMNAARDGLGKGSPFTSPTVANGKVYVSSRGVISVFGLLH